MAKRTPEEIQAQREAWLARKAARESGEDIPKQAPTKAGEDEEASEAAQPSPAPEVTRAPSELQATEASPEPEAQPSSVMAATVKPQAPRRKRTPEEIAAQREAFLAARAAKTASKAATAPAPAPPTEKPVEPTPAPPTAPKPAEPEPKPKPVPAKKELPTPPEPGGPITRREFLNYAWLASIALLSVETVGISLWFAFPNFKEGQFGGLFPIGQAADVLPEVNAPPRPFGDGKFWLVNVDREVNGQTRKGVLALFKICTHLGCLYEWADVTNRFECPCHGSKFELTGDYIAGPARRSLDRFVIQAVAPDGAVKESTAGEPLIVNDDDTLIIDTGARILGSSDIVPA